MSDSYYKIYFHFSLIICYSIAFTNLYGSPVPPRPIEWLSYMLEVGEGCAVSYQTCVCSVHACFQMDICVFHWPVDYGVIKIFRRHFISCTIPLEEIKGFYESYFIFLYTSWSSSSLVCWGVLLIYYGSTWRGEKIP